MLLWQLGMEEILRNSGTWYQTIFELHTKPGSLLPINAAH